MAEYVRLIIWDLDDTFWKGTVTESGVEFIARNNDLVIQLAKRGIISSICSKNDLSKVQPLLEQCGLWQYFVFPSINWEAKGPRIGELVETAMLRPASVLFVDDNPSNLNEARHFVPGLQTATPDILSGLLENPLFKGKDDSELSRLNQYKLLETRREDERASKAKGGSNHDFLRASNIRVRFEFDIVTHIDRAIELINRTNQLNFTKNQLPEDPSDARAALSKLVARYDVQAALVQVADSYGDYGFVGFYAVKTTDGRNDLVHFCFSCRTLGMGIETWVFRRIGRPWLPMVGEVLSDPRDELFPADWISFSPTLELSRDEGLPRYEKLILRGGCNGLSIAHYFHAVTDSVTTEVAISRNGIPIRLDHSFFAVSALDGPQEEFLSAVERLGYQRSDFSTEIFNLQTGKPIILMDFWTDSEGAIYRHRKLGFRIPFTVPYHFPVKPAGNAMDVPRDFSTDGFGSGHPVYAALDALRDEYEYEGLIGEEMFKENLRRILSNISSSANVIILAAKESWLNPGDGLVYKYPAHTSLNAWVAAVAAQFPNVIILDVQECLAREDEAETINHFDRLVYHRIAQRIIALVADATRPFMGAHMTSTETVAQAAPQ